MDWKLEVVVVPVSDVDRAKQFYSEQCGFVVDVDNTMGDMRVVQMTPQGSGCSVTIGTGLTDAAPGSVKGMQLCVGDIDAARAQLLERGVDVSVVRHVGPDGWLDGNGGEWNAFIFFDDPDGNSWTVQESPTMRKELEVGDRRRLRARPPRIARPDADRWPAPASGHPCAGRVAGCHRGPSRSRSWTSIPWPGERPTSTSAEPAPGSVGTCVRRSPTPILPGAGGPDTRPPPWSPRSRRATGGPGPHPRPGRHVHAQARGPVGRRNPPACPGRARVGARRLLGASVRDRGLDRHVHQRRERRRASDQRQGLRPDLAGARVPDPSGDARQRPRRPDLGRRLRRCVPVRRRQPSSGPAGWTRPTSGN